VLATRDDVYQNYPSTAPTRYETLSAAQSLASLERTLHTLLSPFDYPTAGAWLDAALTAMNETVGSELRMPKVAADETAWDAIERAIDAYATTVRSSGDPSSPNYFQKAAMIRVLVPPFRAGVAEWRRLASRRAELTALLDAIKPVVNGVPLEIATLLDDEEVAALQERARWVSDHPVFPVDQSGRRYPWPIV